MSYLLVIPSLDIKDGKTIRVVEGIPELDCKKYGDDPVKMALIWRSENAKMLHIVDFDGSQEYSQKNLEIVEEICSSVIIPTVYTGGVRNKEDADRIIETGVYRLGINTMAVESTKEFITVLEKYGPQKIVVCLDIDNYELVTRGRTIKTGINAVDFAKQMKAIGVERFIVTDIKRNGMLRGPNLQLAKDIAENSGCKVTLAGGIRNKDELQDAQLLLDSGLDSVIIGRALYENRFPCQKLWRVAEAGIFD